ncbi:hypothetical protein F511_34083 [Dorcoceras hygrometricum]|uniref:Uncharacterized protein n=1 Tax=Dorcoceras hygrometricum TaxID=472368 RepID=A0A2Z7CQV7_9LAMI|nr:hypothetical protein F511_34083 [Dorcoceras hygrometricum]
MKSIVEAQNGVVENGSSTDQVQCTREVFKCRAVYKRSDQVQLVGNQLGVEQSWILEASQEKERKEHAQLQTKRGIDIEAAPKEDQLEDENKEAGEEKDRALEGTLELDWSKISSWNSKGTPKLVQQFTSRSAGNTKLVHQLGVGAARRSSVENEEKS